MFSGAFGSSKNIAESLLQSIPLMLCGLGVAVTFKMNVSNIGAEGQFTMGAWAATAFAVYVDIACPSGRSSRFASWSRSWRVQFGASSRCFPNRFGRSTRLLSH